MDSPKSKQLLGDQIECYMNSRGFTYDSPWGIFRVVLSSMFSGVFLSLRGTSFTDPSAYPIAKLQRVPQLKNYLRINFKIFIYQIILLFTINSIAIRNSAEVKYKLAQSAFRCLTESRPSGLDERLRLDIVKAGEELFNFLLKIVSFSANFWSKLIV